MSTAGAGPNLAALDQAAALPIDAEIWNQNLAAVAATDPPLAALLKSTSVPESWRSCAALDGSPAWRTERAGEPPAWLGGSAAPRTRAEGLFGGEAPPAANPLLPTIGSGHEAAFLLSRMAAHQAVFVVEPDAARVCAVLTVLDFAHAISAGRILFSGGREVGAWLLETLNATPGLLPPASILYADSIDSAAAEALRRSLESVSGKVLGRRHGRLEELRRTAARQEASPTPRILAVALTTESLAHETADELASAAQRIGWNAAAFALDAPSRTHPLALAEELTRLEPTLTVCVDHAAAKLPLASGGLEVQLILSPPIEPPSLGAGEFVLAASPAVRAAVGKSAEGGLLDFPWAASQAVVACDPPATRTHDVALLGDLPNDSETACGIDQPTHRMLWEHMRRAAKHWDAEAIAFPEALLRDAERTCKLALNEPELRRRMIRLIERVLVPAALLRAFAAVLDARGASGVGIGKGWTNRNSFSSVRAAVAAGVSARLAIGSLLPVGVTREMVDAMAAGWPPLIHCAPGRTFTEQTGGAFSQGGWKAAFSDAAGLAKGLAFLSDAAALARAATAVRQHALARHRWEQRLPELLEALKKRHASGIKST
ncbi:MAG: hypothetical protein HZB38_03380 [Planctomycetes bacterium]|nr:hypothetical protein [Planctomycetota bacterium]